MVQHLVRVHDVEGVVRQRQGVHVADDEVHVGAPAPLGLRAGQVQGGVSVLERGHPTGRDAFGQVKGDRARAGADLEQALPGPQVRQEVGDGVLGGTPPV